MAKSKRVSSKTHTQAQLNDYANQNNPNNAAYRARKINEKANKKRSSSYDCVADLDWYCFSNPFDFD